MDVISFSSPVRCGIFSYELNYEAIKIFRLNCIAFVFALAYTKNQIMKGLTVIMRNIDRTRNIIIVNKSQSSKVIKKLMVVLKSATKNTLK